MKRTSTSDSSFISTVSEWIEANGEVFVVIHHPNCGGRKDYKFFTSWSSLCIRLAELQPSTFVVVLSKPQLPLRGHVDPPFIERALKQIPDGAEWLIVCQELKHVGKASWYNDSLGDTHAELESELRDDDYFGKQVAVGPEPPWWPDDSDSITSAFVPNADGSITPAAY